MYTSFRRCDTHIHKLGWGPMSPSWLKPLFHSNWTLYLEYVLQKHTHSTCFRTVHQPAILYCRSVFLGGKLVWFPKKTKINVDCCTPDNRLFIIPLHWIWTQAIFCVSSRMKQLDVQQVKQDSGLSPITVGDIAHDCLINHMHRSTHFITNKTKIICSDMPLSKPFSTLETIFWLIVSPGLLWASVTII